MLYQVLPPTEVQTPQREAEQPSSYDIEMEGIELEMLCIRHIPMAASGQRAAFSCCCEPDLIQ